MIKPVVSHPTWYLTKMVLVTIMIFCYIVCQHVCFLMLLVLLIVIYTVACCTYCCLSLVAVHLLFINSTRLAPAEATLAPGERSLEAAFGAA